MKEMTIEQKAKAYDKAIAHAKKLLKTIGNATLGNLVLKNEFETMFHELKESEDERIRKAILELVRQSSEILEKKNQEQMIAWLEKQGEQKPEVKYVYTKFRIGDVIVEKEQNGSCPPVVVKYIGEGHYSCSSSDDTRYLAFPIELEDEYKLVEQNPAWSEEDENGLSDALWCCKQAASIAKDENDMGNVWYAKSWLKSLKPQNTWKPSDEQIQALEAIIGCVHDNASWEIGTEWFGVLFKLKEQLKKLKG